MRGMPRIGHHPGMRQLPRPGSMGGSRGFVSVPGLPGRRSRCGSGPGGTFARDAFGRGVGFFAPCGLTVREMPGRLVLPRGGAALRSAARSFQAPPQGARCGVQPRSLAGAVRRPCRRAADKGLGVASSNAGKAAASSRHALLPRRASVVTTAKLGSDDAVRRRIDNPETRVVRGVSQPGAEERKSAGKCQRAKTRFFRARQKSTPPMFDLVRKAESDARLAGQGSIFASGDAGALRLF